MMVLTILWIVIGSSSSSNILTDPFHELIQGPL